MGCKHLFVATDHKPLVSVLGDQSLADVQNPRLARIKEKTLWWQFKIIHTPGKLQLAADALSRRKGATAYTVLVCNNIDDEEEVMEDIRSRLHQVFSDSASPMGLGQESAGINLMPAPLMPWRYPGRGWPLPTMLWIRTTYRWSPGIS